ncbi:MAG: tetratricopeptide repeat protein, partial [Aquificaceae bacterium]|nr:tetratricopeptide repeat protein [Aquificaceae bacterium]MDW8424271.1 tetratricopeptide repeat protein [Aquificaceae bacterium]
CDKELMESLLKVKDNPEISRYLAYLRDRGLLEKLTEWALEQDLEFKFRLGFFLQITNFTKDAVRIYENLREELSELYQENPERWAGDYATTLNDLALTYSDLSQYDKALELYEKALSIRESLYRQNPERWVRDYGLVLWNLANMHKKQGNHEEAKNILSFLVSLIEKHKLHQKIPKWKDILSDIEEILSEGPGVSP